MSLSSVMPQAMGRYQSRQPRPSSSPRAGKLLPAVMLFLVGNPRCSPICAHCKNMRACTCPNKFVTTYLSRIDTTGGKVTAGDSLGVSLFCLACWERGTENRRNSLCENERFIRYIYSRRIPATVHVHARYTLGFTDYLHTSYSVCRPVQIHESKSITGGHHTCYGPKRPVHGRNQEQCRKCIGATVNLHFDTQHQALLITPSIDLASIANAKSPKRSAAAHSKLWTGSM